MGVGGGLGKGEGGGGGWIWGRVWMVCFEERNGSLEEEDGKGEGEEEGRAGMYVLYVHMYVSWKSFSSDISDLGS